MTERASDGTKGVMLWYKKGATYKRCGWVRKGIKMDLLRTLILDGRLKVFGTGTWTKVSDWDGHAFWEGNINWRCYEVDESGYTTFEDYDSGDEDHNSLE